MSGQIQDGTWTNAGQDGAKTVGLPLQAIGNNYATEVTRRYKELASYFEPLRSTLTSFTTLITQSDTLSTWTPTRTTVTANSSTDPEGGSTATKFAEDNANNTHFITFALTVASGALSYGVLLKASERSYARLRLNNGTDGNLGIAVFSLSGQGALVSGSGTIKKLLNGWFWCYVSGTATIANSSVIIDLSSDGTTFSYQGVTGSGIYVWRATALPTVPTIPWPVIQTTAATRTATAPPVDPDDPLAFLIMESEPDSGDLEFGMASWVRKYADVPASTVRYSTVALVKPAASAIGTSVGTVTVTNSDDSTTSLGTSYAYGAGQFFSNQVYSNLTGTATQTVPAGGTFTLTYKTSTTGALNFGDNNATIAAALNGLADVIADGLTFSVSTALTSTGILTLTVTVGATTSRVTMNGASLTPAAATTAFTRIASTTSQIIKIAFRASITAHGFASSGYLLVTSSFGSLLPYSTHWLVIDANTVAYDTNFFGSAGTNFGQFINNYTPGADRIGTKITSNFYLPGITLGISSPTDIPVPSPLINDAAFLSAVIATTNGYLTYDAQPLDFWNAPIYRQDLIAINMADV